MDRYEEITKAVKALNQYRVGDMSPAVFVGEICEFFEEIKKDEFSPADLSFLTYIANACGVPHYFDLLQNKFNAGEVDFQNLPTVASYLYESSLYTTENSKLHRYQHEILDRFLADRTNRYFLSASTSFGKTFLVFQIIRKMQYRNVVLIFPTIALLSENYDRLVRDPDYEDLKDRFLVHTLSEVSQVGERNIFIFTPERFLSFKEKNPEFNEIDFVFIDEVYKIDNDFLIDNSARENERDVAYRLAAFYALEGDADALLAGPYVDFPNRQGSNYNPSFDRFLRTYGLDILNYNDYEIVSKQILNIKTRRSLDLNPELRIDTISRTKPALLIEVLTQLERLNENSIVYCSGRKTAETYAKSTLESDFLGDHNNHDYGQFLEHLRSYFPHDWILTRALERGLGIHHGLVPKYIQKEVINLFNRGQIRALFSTTTITEGVNTEAKNLLVLQASKGDKILKKFDAKNIAGRAGRFTFHFKGRVLILRNNFLNILEGPPEPIKHKNFDLEAPKDEIDLFYTDDEFLNEQQQRNKVDIRRKQAERGIPEEIISQFKVISRVDKIALFDSIQVMTIEERQAVRNLIRAINGPRIAIDYAGFQTIVDKVEPIVKNAALRRLIENRNVSTNVSVLTHFVHFYLRGGFRASVKYKIDNGANTDDAIRDTAEFVYNTLKYQVVKYIGVFNVMYRHVRSVRENRPIDEIAGIEKLLVKLEYNALSEKGRIASDYGVPEKIVQYYEEPERSQAIEAGFDNYERQIFRRIEEIVSSGQIEG